ncbi:MAG: hypothetical protein H6624_19575 [Bdellovibrionaceae bacterium]|nr:hypothetical protein [Bdellovibrionales bacterium]MCB9086550.1 hypothetical protein [Pseudobdellovibrionaceae bacterium]
MRQVLLALFVFASAAQASAASSKVLKNCYGDDGAQFFVSELEDISIAGQIPVLLFNDLNQVVGVMAVEPKRAERSPNQAKSVEVHLMSLCALGLEVDTFYYAEDSSADLMKWTGEKDWSLAITQDEGMITMNATVEKKSEYATKIKVDFRGYDVFREEEELEPSNDPTFVEDWGPARGTGSFYFYIPRNWLLKN